MTCLFLVLISAVMCSRMQYSNFILSLDRFFVTVLLVRYSRSIFLWKNFMPAPYSPDFRRKALDSYLKNGSLRKTAEKFEVSYGFVRSPTARCKAEKTIEPKPRRSGNPPKIRPEHHPFLKKLIDRENGLSPEEICTRLQNEFSVKISVTAMHESLKRPGIGRKKTFRAPKKSRDTTKWTGYFFELIRFSPEQAVFIDETGTCPNMTPLSGRSPKGEGAYDTRPPAKGISMIGALSFRGLLDRVCFGGTLDGTVSAYYIEKFPSGPPRPGRAVIMDNASPHKNEEAPDLVENTGAEILFPPPCRPELNPIEYRRSKINNFLGKMKPRTADELYDGCSMSLNLIDADMARSCFRHCGF